MGSHVSAVPNHQLGRTTPLYTRANVAFFGTFGYELDLGRLSPKEQEEIKAQTAFMKKYRELLQFGTFYRLSSPFERNEAAWMTVSRDRRTAIVGWYRILNRVNASFSRLKLAGLDPDLEYEINGRRFYGDELMYLGLVTSDGSAGEMPEGPGGSCDFDSRLYLLKA